MTNVATTLLDFILNLLNDPEAMAAYQADREGALTAAGLGGCGDEVDAALTSAGAGHSLYYAPATFHHSDWSDDRDVFVNRVSDDDGIDDSFNRIEDSFNTTITNIDDRDNFVNNGVFVGGDNEGEITNDVDSTNVEGNVEGNVTSIETNGGEGAGSGAIVDASGGDGGDGGDATTNQDGLINVNDVPIGVGLGVGLLGDGTGTGTASADDGGDGGAGGDGAEGGDVTFTN